MKYKITNEQVNEAYHIIMKDAVNKLEDAVKHGIQPMAFINSAKYFIKAEELSSSQIPILKYRRKAKELTEILNKNEQRTKTKNII